MGSFIKLILGAVLRFVWGRAEEWYQTELRYQQHKRILIEEAKNVAREMATADQAIAADVESVDDSFLRLESASANQYNLGRPLFGAFVREGEGGDSGHDSSESAEIPLPESGSVESFTGLEQSGSESMDSGTDSAVSAAE